MTRSASQGPDGTVISAYVASSRGWDKRYSVEAVLGSRESRIVDAFCTCSAFTRYDGLCKHCAALVMDYALRPEKYGMDLMAAQAQEPASPTTSSLIAALMDQTSPSTGEDEGVVDLIPTLTFDYGFWGLRLKVATVEASYVVSDIPKLVRDVTEGAWVYYGKKLAFRHDLGAFTQRAQRLLGLLLDMFEEGRDLFADRVRIESVKRRKPDLSARDLISFLDIMEGSSFEIEGDGARLRRRTRVEVRAGVPPLEARLVPAEGGYVLVLDTEALVVALGLRAYALVDEVFYRCPEDASRQLARLRPLFDEAGESPFVSTQDAPRFCATLLPSLETVAQVAVPEQLEKLRPVPGVLEFYFDKADDAVQLGIQVRYGQRVIPLAGELGGVETEAPSGEASEQEQVPVRDDALEQVGLRLAAEYFPTDLQLPLAEEACVGDLLFGGLARFREAGDVFTTPAFDRLLTDRKPRFTLGIALAGDLLAMDVTAEDLPADELAALLVSYKRKKRYHRLRSGAFLDVAQMDLHQLDVLMDDLGVTPSQLAKGSFELPTYSAFFLDREFADVRRNVEFTEYVERFRSIDQERYELPPSLEGVLRPYQAEGFRWLSTLMDLGLGGILADEMGLGKSIQLISLLLARRQEARETGPSLIVCPASLVYNWLAEFERFAPELAVRAVAGTKSERARLRRQEGIDVLVTSYDLLRIDIKDYEGRDFFCYALDEAQYIKNHATLTSRAVKRVSARHRFALTGTPVENRLAELWSAFDFLMPGLLGSYEHFRKRYELGIVGGDEALSQRLAALVGPFVLRRLKTDVLSDLPEKLESVVRVELTGEQRKLYLATEQRLREELSRQKRQSASRSKGKGAKGTAKAQVDEGSAAIEAGKGTSGAKGLKGAAGAKAAPADRSQVEVLAELTRLRQMALDPGLVLEGYRGGAAKLDAILELVAQAVAAGQKMLVFSQFTSFLAELAEALDQQGTAHYRITGSTPKKRRVELVDAFNDDDTPVFLISLKAGGTGLNLTGASLVVHADPWWNAAAQQQATDRAHRIGQQQVVNVCKIIAADTIEERILKLQQRKSALADAVIGANGAEALSGLTRDQLLELLG